MDRFWKPTLNSSVIFAWLLHHFLPSNNVCWLAGFFYVGTCFPLGRPRWYRVACMIWNRQETASNSFVFKDLFAYPIVSGVRPVLSITTFDFIWKVNCHAACRTKCCWSRTVTVGYFSRHTIDWCDYSCGLDIPINSKVNSVHLLLWSMHKI